MYVEYPRCPQCQYPLVKCKRYTSLIKKIQGRIENISPSMATLSESEIYQISRLVSLSIGDVTLPEKITTIIERHKANTRHHKLIKLFMHVVSLFQKLNDLVSTERDRLLKAVYEHVEKSDSIFLTRQQWLDLENEYNRLIFVDRFRTSKELLQPDFDVSVVQTLNDILFGPNQFTELACELCNAFLNNDSNNDKWKSILLEATKWNDFEKNRLICDGKWIVCPKGEKIG